MEQLLIDVGINRINITVNGETKNKLVGDVDYDQAKNMLLPLLLFLRRRTNDNCMSLKKHNNSL